MYIGSFNWGFSNSGKLSFLYDWIWFKVSVITHISGTLLICEGPSNFQNHAIQIKFKITQDVIKKDICLYGRLGDYPKAWNLSL